MKKSPFHTSPPANHPEPACRRSLELLARTGAFTDHVEEFAAKLAELRNLLATENRKHNLTRIIDEEGFWVKHVFDSLLIAEAYPAIFADGAKFADIGCGAGFPSLVLAAAFPNIHITAIDSRGKKTDFVALAAKRLEFENITVVHGRGRELARREEFKKRFDVIVARAVSDAGTVFREVRGMMADSSTLILYKSPESAKNELREIRAAKSAVLEWSASETFSLPNQMGERVFLRGLKHRNG